MTVHHCAVWIDHREARIFKFDGGTVEQSAVQAGGHHEHAIRREPVKHPDETKFFHEVAGVLQEAERVLVLGPSTAKLGLLRHLHAHHAGIEAKVVGVETVDHPTDPQLVAYAKEYFARPVQASA